MRGDLVEWVRTERRERKNCRVPTKLNYFLTFVRESTKVGNVTFTMVVAFRFVFPFLFWGGGGIGIGMYGDLFFIESHVNS